MKQLSDFLNESYLARNASSELYQKHTLLWSLIVRYLRQTEKPIITFVKRSWKLRTRRRKPIILTLRDKKYIFYNEMF